MITTYSPVYLFSSHVTQLVNGRRTCHDGIYSPLYSYLFSSHPTFLLYTFFLSHLTQLSTEEVMETRRRISDSKIDDREGAVRSPLVSGVSDDAASAASDSARSARDESGAARKLKVKRRGGREGSIVYCCCWKRCVLLPYGAAVGKSVFVVYVRVVLQQQP